MVFEGLKTLEDMDFKGKKVLLRADLDVPVAENGDIRDDLRLQALVPTIRKLFNKGTTQLFIMGHLGRPGGKVDETLRLDKVSTRIFELTKKTVEKLNDCINIRKEDIPSPDEAQIVVLENLRFHEEEEIDGADFARELASLANVYVNDAFATAHREHASVHAIVNYIPSCIGLVMEQELKTYNIISEFTEHPFIAIIGGAKLETKIPVIKSLLSKTDKILLGGAQIFTFYKALGYSIGKSLYDKDSYLVAKMLNNNDKIVLPVDVAVADDRDNPTQIVEMKPENIPSYMIGLDLGKKSIEQFKEILGKAKMVVWNGPLGYYENKQFLLSTVALLKFLAERKDIKTVIGGGDTAAIVKAFKLQDKFFHVSTGGGAFLTLLEGKSLPAIKIQKR